MKTLQDYIDKLNKLNFKEMYEGDFFLTWEKSDDELEAVWTVADALRFMRENNISTKVFESGLGISLFRDNSTRTRFSFASACNLLGLSLIHISSTRPPAHPVQSFARRLRRTSITNNKPKNQKISLWFPVSDPGPGVHTPPGLTLIIMFHQIKPVSSRRAFPQAGARYGTVLYLIPI